MKKTSLQLASFVLLGCVAADVVYVYECAAPVVSQLLSSSTTTSFTTFSTTSSTSSSIADTVNPINNSASSSTSISTSTSTSLSSSTQTSLSSFLSTQTSSAFTTTSTSTSTVSLTGSSTTSRTATNSSTPGPNTVTVPTAQPSSDIALPTSSYFAIRAGDTAANGKYLQNFNTVPNGNAFLAFNPFGAINTIVILQLDPVTSHIYYGPKILCVDRSSNNPKAVTDCDPATTSDDGASGFAPLKCTITATGSIQCIVGANLDGPTDNFVLFSDSTGMLDLLIGPPTTDARYIPVTLYVYYVPTSNPGVTPTTATTTTTGSPLATLDDTITIITTTTSVTDVSTNPITTPTPSTTNPTIDPPPFIPFTTPVQSPTPLPTTIPAFQLRASTPSNPQLNNQLLQSYQTDAYRLILNPSTTRYPGVTAQSFQIEPSTGHVYMGGYILAVFLSSGSPAEVIVSDPAVLAVAVQASSRAALICALDAGGLLLCGVEGATQLSVFQVQVASDDGSARLSIGSAVMDGFVAVSFYSS